MRYTCIVLSAIFALLLEITPAPRHAPQQNEYTTPVPAFRIAENLYYVGSKDLASYLVATPEGHILSTAILKLTFR